MQIHSFTLKHNNSPTFGRAVYMEFNTNKPLPGETEDSFSSSQGINFDVKNYETLGREREIEELTKILEDSTIEYYYDSKTDTDEFSSLTNPFSNIDLKWDNGITIHQSTKKNNIFDRLIDFAYEEEEDPELAGIYELVIGKLTALKSKILN